METPSATPNADTSAPDPFDHRAAFCKDVAKGQKMLIMAVIIQLLSVIPQVGWIAYVGGTILAYWGVYTMGDALQAHRDGLAVGGGSKWLFLLWMPYIGFVAMLILNYKATKVLQEGGYKVGLFGARPRRNAS